MLHDTTIGDIAVYKRTVASKDKPPQLVELEAHASIKEAIELFQQFQILSILIYGKAGHFVGSGDTRLTTHGGKVYIGILSLVDCLCYLLAVPEKQSENDSCLSACGASIESQTLWVVPPLESLKSVMEAMSKGIHTFLVASTDPVESSSLELISQTDILRYIHSVAMQENAESSRIQVPLNRIFTFPQEIISARPDDTVSDTLKVMNLHGIRSVILQDSHRHIVDYFSISDLRIYLWTASRMDISSRSALTFLETTSLRDFLAALRGHFQGPGVVVLPSSTLADAIEYALQSHVHRVWVVDGIVKHERRAIGVITYTDMIRQVYRLTLLEQ
ncbi:hypothetical protein HDU91_002041 [Kappamyces sp. JEL0680]|nr:hypothetical protein HDU91_002041 [Kappamyces sp. JEL0680]